MDLKTFQDNFEKVHISRAQKQILPHLLRNNFLNEALLLVKIFEDVDEIWRRLRKALDYSRLLLSKKLVDVNNLGTFWKAKIHQTLPRF